MMKPPSFLIAEHPRRGTLWAAVDPNARFTKAEIATGRFSAYLAPFSDEESARAALIAAGALRVDVEQRSQGKQRGAR